VVLSDRKPRFLKTINRQFGVIPKIARKTPRSLRPERHRLKTPYGKQVTIAHPFSSYIGFQVATQEKYPEPETVALFTQLIQDARLFFDIGANIGLYTFQARLCNPDAHITTFEPQEHIHALLEQSLRLNGWYDIVTEQIALTDFDGSTTLHIVPTSDSSASLNAAFRRNTVEQQCRTMKLDSYCAERGIDQVSLLKIDTESTEPAVLHGGREIIGDCKPDILCEVLKDRTEQELQQFFAPLGYSFYHVTPHGPLRKQEIAGDPAYRCLNYLFTTRRSV
jgi:FkbM family methyltransferase